MRERERDVSAIISSQVECDESLLVICRTSSIFSSVSSNSERPDRGSSLTTSLPSGKRLAHLRTVRHDGMLGLNAVASSS